MDFRIELVPLAVSDVDRSIAFYGETVGWPIDFERRVSDDLRFVQVTPPGSACSFCFGEGLGMLPDGQKQYVQVVVADADEALAHLSARGVETRGVEEYPWGRFVFFEDPDGNTWALQQIIRAGG